MLTSVPSMRMRPSETSSSPAMSRSNVDLPQPEGPTKTTKEPSSTSRSTFGITATLPKVFFTPCREMLPIVVFLLPALLHGAEGEAADELALAEPADDEDRRDGERRRRRELGPEQPLGAR